MLDLLFAVVALPLASALVLSLFGARLGRRVVASLGAGSIGLAAATAIAIAIGFLRAPPHAHTQTLYRWIAVDGFESEAALYLDSLSLVMILIVTVVGFLIHVYAAEYMEDEEGYSRFFAYMNLFVGSMLVLVLADNLALLYLGWEGVGMCSYLLIGFWYREPANGRAARKAFVVTRIGDVALIVGLFVLFKELGTLDIQEVMGRAQAEWPVGSGLAVLAAALLLGGAVGKSAQLPLQTWLPDAMAGPTPVSALIHAATMVTAGIYLIARTHGLFELAPVVLGAVATIGLATLLLAGLAALTQREIKRVLAYSTISQLGYMFLALGVGAWAVAIFHLMTHAFFKALLFLGAGVISHAQGGKHDIFEMGGLARKLPVPFLMFLIAGGSLAGFPFITAGFYSKESLLLALWASDRGGVWLWGLGLLGSFVTALYIFRLVFLVFLGEQKTPVSHLPRLPIKASMGVLAVMSIVGGLVELPATLGDRQLFSRLLQRTLPAPEIHHASLGAEWTLQVAAMVASLSGMALAWAWFVRRPQHGEDPMHIPGITPALHALALGGWGFDELYDRALVVPFCALARWAKADVVDRWPAAITAGARHAHGWLRATQTGRLRWYAAWIAIGAVVLVAILVSP